jgi:hypothetical protein
MTLTQEAEARIAEVGRGSLLSEPERETLETFLDFVGHHQDLRERDCALAEKEQALRAQRQADARRNFRGWLLMVAPIVGIAYTLLTYALLLLGAVDPSDLPPRPSHPWP